MSGSIFTVRLLGATATLLLAAACSSTTTSPVSGNNTLTPGAGTSATTSASGGAAGVATTSLGPVLVDSKGFTVYMLTADTKGHSTCSAQCLQYWPSCRHRPEPACPGPGRQRGPRHDEGDQWRVDGDRGRLAALYVRQGQGSWSGRRSGHQDLWRDLVCRVAIRFARHGGFQARSVSHQQQLGRRRGRLRLLSLRLSFRGPGDGVWVAILTVRRHDRNQPSMPTM